MLVTIWVSKRQVTKDEKSLLSQLQEKQIALIGMPFDDYSSF